MSALSRSHVWRPGGEGPPLLLLHGTGGNEHDLLPLADRLSPDSPVLSPRGTVLEGRLPRFFRRLAEGVFDEDDLRLRVDELAEFVLAAEAEYRVTAGSWVAVGFSNGANIGSALLLQRPEILAGAVLFAAMVPFAQPPVVDLFGRYAVLSNGRGDPLATASQTATLVSQLTAAGAEVSEFGHNGGHTVDPAQLPAIAQILRTHDLGSRAPVR